MKSIAQGNAYDLTVVYENPELGESLHAGVWRDKPTGKLLANVHTVHGDRVGYSVVAVPLDVIEKMIIRARETIQ